LAYHALEVMESVLESAHKGTAVAIESTVERPGSVELTVLAEQADALQSK
jgi:hypothetical protein